MLNSLMNLEIYSNPLLLGDLKKESLIKKFYKRSNLTNRISSKKFSKTVTQKLKLLQSLRLPQREIIQYLISGITDFAIRNTAASLDVDSVNDFLNKMHNITKKADGLILKRSSPVKTPLMRKDKIRDSKDTILKTHL